jgi:hypothetical protein
LTWNFSWFKHKLVINLVCRWYQFFNRSHLLSITASGRIILCNANYCVDGGGISFSCGKCLCQIVAVEKYSRRGYNEWPRIRDLGWNFMYSFFSLLSDMWVGVSRLSGSCLNSQFGGEGRFVIYYELYHFYIIEHDYSHILHQKERILTFTLWKISNLHNLAFSFYLWLESRWALVLIVAWDIQSLNSSLRIHYHLLVTK